PIFPSKASPEDEKLATCPTDAFSTLDAPPSETLTVCPCARRVNAARAAPVGIATTGIGIDSSRPSPPAGSAARPPYRSTADAPACAARAAAGAGDAPIGTSAACPATRLTPVFEKKSAARG